MRLVETSSEMTNMVRAVARASLAGRESTALEPWRRLQRAREQKRLGGTTAGRGVWELTA